jgi:hypothetical protein
MAAQVAEVEVLKDLLMQVQEILHQFHHLKVMQVVMEMVLLQVLVQEQMLVQQEAVVPAVQAE